MMVKEQDVYPIPGAFTEGADSEGTRAAADRVSRSTDLRHR